MPKKFSLPSSGNGSKYMIYNQKQQVLSHKTRVGDLEARVKS